MNVIWCTNTNDLAYLAGKNKDFIAHFEQLFLEDEYSEVFYTSYKTNTKSMIADDGLSYTVPDYFDLFPNRSQMQISLLIVDILLKDFKEDYIRIRHSILLAMYTLPLIYFHDDYDCGPYLIKNRWRYWSEMRDHTRIAERFNQRKTTLYRYLPSYTEICQKWILFFSQLCYDVQHDTISRAKCYKYITVAHIQAFFQDLLQGYYIPPMCRQCFTIQKEKFEFRLESEYKYRHPVPLYHTICDRCIEYQNRPVWLPQKQDELRKQHMQHLSQNLYGVDMSKQKFYISRINTGQQRGTVIDRTHFGILKFCRCGSSAHQTITHPDCPLNKKNNK